MKKCNIILSIFFGFFIVIAGNALADGNEELGPAIVKIIPGTHIIAAGTGMVENEEGDITVKLPAGAEVVQALLYWEGISEGENIITEGQDSITINGLSPELTGKLIGSIPGPRTAYSYRADVTKIIKGIVAGDEVFITVSNMDFSYVNNGAGLLIIYNDKKSDFADIDIRDGIDQIWYKSTIYDRTVSVEQTFDFEPTDYDRIANLSMFFSSVFGTFSGGGFRPTVIRITVGGNTTLYHNELNSFDGPEWDSLNLKIDIPAGTSEVRVQAYSEDVDPPFDGKEGEKEGEAASFRWITAGFSITPPPPEGGEGCTPGYWKQSQHFFAWSAPYTQETLFFDVFEEDAFPYKTLLDVLKQGGGGLNALGRHTVAALLNAASPDTNYDLTPNDVIETFKAVHSGTKIEYNAQKDIFEDFNEQGCPLGNGKEIPGTDDVLDPDADINGAYSSSDISTLSKSSGSNSSCFISSIGN